MADFTRSGLPVYSKLDEPLLSFGDPAKPDVHPLRGLKEAGPFSRNSFGTHTPAVRVAMVGPSSGRKDVSELLNSLRQQHAPGDRKDYVPPFSGFQDVFGASLQPAADGSHIEWPDTVEALESSGTPSERLASAMRGAIQRLSLVRDKFDVAVFHLPDSWAPALRTETFDAHDELKAMAAVAGIPTQVLNDRVFTFLYKASRAWRLSIALYVKAGGIPWKLAPLPGTPADTAFIGLAYAMRGDPREARFVTCCSQVFDADGGGMQFVAYDARDPIEDDETARRNPYLSRADMRAVLARSLRLYQHRNGGRFPRRVVVHKTTEFRAEEVAGAGDALSSVEEVDCIQITTSTAWRGVWLVAPTKAGMTSQADRYPVPRGVVQPLSGRSCLVWVAGNSPGVSKTGNYFQGQKSIPKPIILTRHAGRGSLEQAALEAIGLTKMDWNNDALYDPVPVTILYSQRLAQTIAHVPSLPRSEYPYRLFM